MPEADEELDLIQQRKEERRRERQKQLTRLIREESLDWEAMREFMYVENLNPNYTDPSTLITTAHMAASDGETEILRWCIRAQADVNSRSSIGRTVLHHACSANHPRCIRLLLESAADANIRTLAHLTPLHLCCQSDGYEAVLILLDQTSQVIDVDAEDSRRRVAESLTKDKRIIKAIKKYRSTLDERRQEDLLDQWLRRFFKLFDSHGNNFIYPEEWAETLALVAQHFEHHNDDRIEEMFDQADANHDGVVDWDEFKAAHTSMLEALGVPFRQLMDNLCDIETTVFKEKLRLSDCAGSSKSPVLSARAKALAAERSRRASATQA